MKSSIGRHVLSPLLRSVAPGRAFSRRQPRVRYSTFEPLVLPKTEPVQPPTPPLSKRVKALIPFLIWWTIITSLVTNNLRLRTSSREELDTRRAQISVLESLVDRLREGTFLADDELRRELEMVGLRERTSLTGKEGEELRGTSDVNWTQALFGRKKKKSEDEEVKEVIAEWAQLIHASSDTPSNRKPSPAIQESGRSGVSRRAPSTGVYM